MLILLSQADFMFDGLTLLRNLWRKGKCPVKIIVAGIFCQPFFFRFSFSCEKHVKWHVILGPCDMTSTFMSDWIGSPAPLAMKSHPLNTKYRNWHPNPVIRYMYLCFLHIQFHDESLCTVATSSSNFLIKLLWFHHCTPRLPRLHYYHSDHCWLWRVFIWNDTFSKTFPIAFLYWFYVNMWISI